MIADALQLGSTAALGPADYEVITYLQKNEGQPYASTETVKDEEAAHASFLRRQAAAADLPAEWIRRAVFVIRRSPVGLKDELAAWHSEGKAA